MAITSLFPNEQHLGLMTDLHDLAMAAGYFAHGLADRKATFEIFVDRLPERRNYLVAAGLAQAVHFLQRFSFSPEQLKYLRQHPVFAQVPAAWYEKLANSRFEGDLWALPEGTLFFPPAPVLRVTAPLMVAQLLENYLQATITAQTLVASKASRLVTAADGKPVLEFGSRRAHGPQAGMLAARAAAIAGTEGTSHGETARRLGIPAIGSQSHSWFMAFADEADACRKFAELFPAAATLVVDTHDALGGLAKAIACGAPMQAVRLGGGDLLALSREVRSRLDAAGRQAVRIVASGSLDEWKIAHLQKQGAPIDAFGVGTELVTSRDEASLATHCSLVELETEYGTTGRVKGSGDRKTFPYAKQVYRFASEGGRFEFDTIVRETELLEGDPLLVQVMKGGELLGPMPSLADSRKLCDDQRRRLPAELLGLDRVVPGYRVEISKHLQREAERLLAGGST